MKLFSGILLITISIVILTFGMIYIWTFQIIWFRLWLSSIVAGFFIVKINEEIKD